MKPRLAYILAASHSGSTLLAMLLGAHPQVCTVGELKATSLGAPNRYRCSCRELIKHCPFWARVREAMAARGYDFDITHAGTDLGSGSTSYTRRLLRPLHRGPVLERLRDAALWCSPAWRKALPAIQARNLALVQSLLDLTGAKIVVDSSKVGLRLKYLLAIPELDVKVIHLVRDGRAVAATYSRPHELADARDPALRHGGNGDQWCEEGRPIRAGAREWRRSNEEAENILRCLPPHRWIQVRYEQVCTDTEATLENVLRFLDLDPIQRKTEFRSTSAHVIGNGMRLDTSSTVSLDKRWREAMSVPALKEFEAVAGVANRQYGYE